MVRKFEDEKIVQTHQFWVSVGIRVCDGLYGLWLIGNRSPSVSRPRSDCLTHAVQSGGPLLLMQGPWQWRSCRNGIGWCSAGRCSPGRTWGYHTWEAVWLTVQYYKFKNSLHFEYWTVFETEVIRISSQKNESIYILMDVGFKVTRPEFPGFSWNVGTSVPKVRI